MTDSTNNSFEEQWQHAFEDAELTPPESMWDKIELGLKPENTLPSISNFGNKPYYFMGGIAVAILGIFLWFNMVEKTGQVVDREEIKVEKSVVENKTNISPKAVGVITNDIKYNTKKVVEVVGLCVSVNTNHGAEIVEKVEEPLSVSPQSTNEEVPERTLTDSVEMIEPLTTKSIHSEFGSPNINLPADQTPYYVKPIPKPQKKSILKNVKISVGAGVYQQ